MAGRQAHGRSLLPKSTDSGAKKQRPPFKKSRNTAQATALDAFAIAQAQVPERRAKGIRTRDLEEEPERTKRNRDDDEDSDEDDEDGDDDDEAPVKKRAKKGDEFEGFSGSETDEEEWHVGVNEDDEDSDIDSDEAMGDSDNEKFDGYAFSGSNSLKKKKARKEEDDDSDLESLGSDAIDLATALDQFSEDDAEEEAGSEDEDDSDVQSSESEDDDDSDNDRSKLDALQNAISGFAGDDSDDEDQAQQGSRRKTKLSLSDLGLAGVKDPQIKKSLKLMNKEEKAAKTGSSKKLAVPLAKRQQDTLLRSVAYEKTSQTLERWIDTVKHNRRADHLVFPLAQNAHDKGLDNQELQPITSKTTTTDLESTILAIMEESGLGPSAKAEGKDQDMADIDDSKLSQAELKEVQRQRRRERELHSREQVRAKRIKKIKSKAYRRIHRKELAREERKEHEALLEAGEIDSEEDREAEDRRRALERVGAKHRESKWAKLGKKAGRAVWDEDFRSGLTEMAQRKEDLRRRIEGRKNGSDDDGDSDSDGSADSGEGYEKKRLLEQLAAADGYDDDEPKSALMKMAFMQRGEALRKKENDDLVDQIRRDLDSDNEGDDSDEAADIGRRQFGMGENAAKVKLPTRKANAKTGSAAEPVIFRSDVPSLQTKSVPAPDQAPVAPGGVAGAWSRPEAKVQKSKKSPKGRVDELDLSNAAMLATKPSKRTATAAKNGTLVAEADESDDEDAIHLPMAIRDQELIKRAFAGEDVVGEFEREKAEIQKEEDDKEIDNTLPGWGTWAGDGVSKRDLARHKGRFVTKVEGVKQKDRKDYKLKSVIINEKRVKKVCFAGVAVSGMMDRDANIENLQNDQFLASSLPHPFESQQQYERSLRIPVGPEWTTKETYQDATKPRVIIKQGIIAPMSKPML